MRLMNWIAFIAALSATALFNVAFSQDAASNTSERAASATPGESDADQAAIQVQSQAFVAAFNKRDAKAVAVCWTKDGEYVDNAGNRFAGRDEIEKAYADFFAANPDVQIRIAIDSLRLLGANAAIEDGRAVVEPSPTGVLGVSEYTAVHVRNGGQWLMASVRDSWTETPVAVRSAADLQWLIGTWSAEERGVRTESVCRWVADERFLERRYTTTQVDGATTSGVQLIGWNPLAGHVQSWDFSPDGGHAIGFWSATEGGWQAEVHGTTGDGVPTAAINILRRLDDSAYVWQSVQRSLGDSVLPDTNEVVIKRSVK